MPAEKISIQGALKSHIVRAAYASFEEQIKGTIEPGKLADFVMLEKNIVEIQPSEIRNVKVLNTVVGGKSVYAVK